MSLLSKYSNAQDIRRAIEEKAAAYAPEWRYFEDDPDAGTAIALAFADMFGETAERLGRVPYRYFIYFLNMLETKVRTVSPAMGLVSFRLASNATAGRRIPEKTQLYANVPTSRGESERVTFETTHEITAIPAKLTNVYGVDPRHDIINAIDAEKGGAKLFYSDFDNNLQMHRFKIWQNNVLNLKNPSRVTIRLESARARFEGGKNTEKLADPGFASWSYVCSGKSEPFTKVYTNEGALMLELDGMRPEQTDTELPGPGKRVDPEMQPHIICLMHPGRQEPGITADNITLGSAYLYPEQSGVHIMPDYVYFNDIALRPQEPGYLFGKEPNRYDSMLISCDEVFSKRGARVNLTIVMHTVIREVGTPAEGPVYNFDGRYIIDKEDGKVVTPDNMYISEVIWEYWNNVGWAHLEIESGGTNPFKSNEDVRHEHISFICPKDMAQSHQNSIWGCWIRARVIDVENPFSQYGRWQLPFAESISFDYDYGNNLQSAQNLEIKNNAESIMLTANEITQGVSLYKPLPYPEHAFYLAFDKKPAGLPLSVYFGFNGSSAKARTLSFERMVRDATGSAVFKPCKALDETDGLKDSGLISMYVPDDMTTGRIFGVDAYWLRVADGDLRYSESVATAALSKIEINAAHIIQKQTASNEYYSTGLFNSGKVVTLQNRPVLSCEVFVDEINDIGSEAGANPLQARSESGVPAAEYEYDNDGSMTRAWVKWDIVPSLTGIGADDRAVSLDPEAGVLRFGDGKAGRVPPAGTRNIRVQYSYGGGSIGNVPPGAIAGLSANIQTVAHATNFTSTGGGSDNADMKILEKIGPARIHHRGRAVTSEDFENLLLEEFPEIADVKAFAGFDSEGRRARSCVTVVILPKDTENREQVLKLCKAAYQHLSQRAHCELVAASKLSVVPALMMTVNSIIEAVAEDITRSAATERAIVNAIAGRLTNGNASASQGHYGMKIGKLPSVNDIFDCLRGIPNLSYVDRISLEGCYYDDGKQVMTPLDKPDDYPFACALNGTHIVRF